MKNVIWLLALCVVFDLNAQNYSKIQVKNGRNLMPQLLELGIDIDHSTHQDADLLLEISDYEIAQLRQANLSFSVLIPDLEAYYSERIRTAANQKLSSSGSCRPSKIATPSHFHLGSMGGSFTLQELIHQLDSMALLYPTLITNKQAISSTLSIEGRSIWYVKISDNPNQDENEPEVLYSALHHAREGGSLSELIYYMWYLLENYATDPSIQALVNNRELYFVPCLNPDGYYYNELNNPAGGGMWRKNRRLNADNTYGVDLNRNYGFNWGFNNQGSSPNPASDTYRGTAPFSEPETQAMQDFCNNHQFKVALNAHTFGNFLITPWGFQVNGNTPDSSRFTEWGDYLTRENRYYHGSSMQTVNYAVNGNSDDWMYGEQISKGKIMAFTPEMGGPGDGFWPQPNRIEDNCRSALEQNLRLACLAGSHVAFVDEQDQFVQPNAFIHYALKDIGLQAGTATISLIPLQGFGSFGPAKSYTFTTGQQISDSISFVLSSGFQPGQTLRYVVQLNDGDLLFRDTLEKVLGPAQTLFYSNGNASPAFSSSGWGQSSQVFYTPPASWSDSPIGPYQSGSSNYLGFANPLSLQQALRPHLQFRFRYELEKSYDDVRLLISTNQGQNFIPLCGKYSSPDYTYDGTFPIYDGRQAGWVKEEIDLSPYAGSNVLIRWQLNSDFFDERDGIYLDEILLRAIVQDPSGTNENWISDQSLSVYPNPASEFIRIFSNLQPGSAFTVLDLLGRRIFEGNTNTEGFAEWSVSEWNEGIYILQINDGGNSSSRKFCIAKP